VLYPVRRPVTTLDWILLRFISFALVPRLGPEINSRACLWVSPRPRHWVPCWLTNRRPSLFCRSRLETPRAGSGPKIPRAEPPQASPSAISLPVFHGCEYKKPIYTAKRFLNSCQDGTNASILSEIILKNNYILWE
jgi:hypothetical protein